MTSPVATGHSPQSWRSILSGRAAILLICTIVCFAQIIQLLSGFFTGEKWSSNQVIKEHSTLKFPNITLCNFNRISLAKAAKVGLTETNLHGHLTDSGLLQNWTTYNWYKGSGVMPLTTNPHMHLKKDPRLEFPRKFYNYFKSKNAGVNITSLSYKLAHDCRESIVFCQFSSLAARDCCAKHTQTFTDYGVCVEHQPNTYDLNAPVQFLPGIRGGYSFIYNLQRNNRIKMSVDNSIEDGMIMLINFDRYYTAPVVVRSRVHAYVDMSFHSNSIEHAGLSFFKEPCTYQTETSNYKLRYTSEICIFDCWYKAVAERCNCTSQVVLPENAKHPYCEPDDVEGCVYSHMYPEWMSKTTSLTYLGRLTSCMASCKKECFSNLVKTSVTYADYPSSEIIDNYIKLSKLDHNITLSNKYVLDNFILVDVFYSSLSETANQLQPQATLEQLIGNVGGQIGLWLGASIITLYEAVHAMIAKYRKKKIVVEKKISVTSTF